MKHLVSCWQSKKMAMMLFTAHCSVNHNVLNINEREDKTSLEKQEKTVFDQFVTMVTSDSNRTFLHCYLWLLMCHSYFSFLNLGQQQEISNQMMKVGCSDDNIFSCDAAIVTFRHHSLAVSCCSRFLSWEARAQSLPADGES